jgi:hypothetical protein
MRITTAILCASALVAACSTDPYSFTYQSRELNSTGPNTGAVAYRREPASISEFNVDAYFTVDGERVAEVESGEEVVIHLPPGQHVVGVYCDYTGNARLNEQMVDVKPGKRTTFRSYSGFGEVCAFTPMGMASTRQ